MKRLFKYIGIENEQAAIKIDFVFINQTYDDVELHRTFHASNATMFACDQPVLLPHVSRQKCTCMVKDSSISSKGQTRSVSLGLYGNVSKDRSGRD